MVSSQSATKKRKRSQDEDSSVGEGVTISLSDQPASQIGPVVASFPALLPSSETAYQCYAEKGAVNATYWDFASSSRPIHVAGENANIEFFTSDETQITASSGCRYLIGVYNKKTRKVTVQPAPLQIMTRRVKALKKFIPASVIAPQWLEARNTLGETFGTKRAQKAIRAAERNKVDVSAMAGVAGHLQETIGRNTSTLPSIEEAKAAADESRLIPLHNSNASTPAEVYRLHDIIPENEFSAIPIAALLSASSSRERQAMLPYTHSNWINQHLNLLFSAPKPNHSDARTIWYISAMLAFRSASSKTGDKQLLQDRLRTVPSVILDGLLARFTERARGSSRAQVTTQNQTNLLTHMFALCLRTDDYATDTTLIGSDLSMSVPKINSLFKSLGCKIEQLSNTELVRLGLPSTASETKRAVLRVPVEFPRPRAKRRN